MQPLDVGFYGPLKKSWYKHLRLNSRQQPDDKVKKQNFAWHWQMPFMNFYDPFTVQTKFDQAALAFCEDPEDSTPLTLSSLYIFFWSIINRLWRQLKLKRKSFVDELPDNHMSGKGIGVTRLKSLEKAKSFALKEKKA